MGSANGTLGELLTTPAPMIARAVSLTIVVRDVDAARSSLDSILAQNHGYAAQLNASRPENGSRSLLSSLRIPAGELQPAVDALKRLGRVESESQSGEEVSQQHADIAARLKTARETEERFQAILQQRTGKISDVLEVEQNIARLRGEIEAMESQQKALEHRVDYASVEVQLHEEYKARLDSGTISASTQMHNAFVAGYHHVTESLLGLALFVEEYGPALVLWLVILGLPIVLVWRRYKRIRSAI
jgi:chromosome segregation ATPase